MDNRPNSTADQKQSGGEEGFALLAVLGFLLILSAVLIPFASSARIRAMTAANQFDEVRLRRALMTLNSLVAHQLAANTAPDEGEARTARLSQFHCTLGRGLLDIQIQEHSGLIDLNVASVELLQLGLLAAGTPSSPIRELAQTISQYRRLDGDRDAIVPPGMMGEEGLKYAPFEDVAELYDFLPLRSISYGQLMQVFTVNSESAVVSSSTLSPVIKTKSLEYSEAEKAIVATVTQGTDYFTIESVYRAGRTANSETGVYQIGASNTGFVRFVNSFASDLMPPGGTGVSPGDCSQILDKKAQALFNGVF